MQPRPMRRDLEAAGTERSRLHHGPTLLADAGAAGFIANQMQDLLRDQRLRSGASGSGA